MPAAKSRGKVDLKETWHTLRGETLQHHRKIGQVQRWVQVCQFFLCSFPLWRHISKLSAVPLSPIVMDHKMMTGAVCPILLQGDR